MATHQTDSRTASNGIPHDTIRKQLHRILSHDDFRASARLKRLLSFLVEETLSGRGHQLKAYNIATEGLLRSAAFDPATDPIVRVEVRRLRQALERYYLIQRAEPVRIDIPKGTHVPVFHRHVPAHMAPVSQAQPTGDANALETCFNLTTGPSVAMLPFANLSGDDDQRHFAAGLTEQLVIALTRCPGFHVVGPLPKDRLEVESRVLGQQIGVRFVLRGGVRKRGHLIRIGMMLTDTVSGANLWAQQYERDLEAVTLFEIADEITRQVVDLMTDPYGIIPRALIKDIRRKSAAVLTPYEAMLSFSHYIDAMSVETQLQAQADLERTLERDPSQALVSAALADVYASDFLTGFGQVENPLERAEDLVRRALALDLTCAHAYFTMGQIRFAQFQREACLQALEQCLRLSLNDNSLHGDVGYHLCLVGEWERGLPLLQQRLTSHPHHGSWYRVISTLHYYRQGDYEAAYTEALRMKRPDSFWDRVLLAAILGQLGRQPEGAAVLQDMQRTQPNIPLPELLRRLFFSDDNVDMVMDGLHRAGWKKMAR